MLKLDCCFPHP